VGSFSALAHFKSSPQILLAIQGCLLGMISAVPISGDVLLLLPLAVLRPQASIMDVRRERCWRCSGTFQSPPPLSTCVIMLRHERCS
jgi:hypothetical protein